VENLASANPEFFEQFMAELRVLAQSAMRRERQDHTLGPTALIHEAFIRMKGGSGSWESRSQFLSAAANLMRQILIDHARAHRTEKRGGGKPMQLATDPVSLATADPLHLLDIDRAITELSVIDPRAAKVVELRYYAGCTVEETADALNVSPKTVKRDWSFARVWLEKQLLTQEAQAGSLQAGGPIER